MNKKKFVLYLLLIGDEYLNMIMQVLGLDCLRGNEMTYIPSNDY